MVKVTSNTPNPPEVPANTGVQISQKNANIINVAGQSDGPDLQDNQSCRSRLSTCLNMAGALAVALLIILGLVIYFFNTL